MTSRTRTQMFEPTAEMNPRDRSFGSRAIHNISDNALNYHRQLWGITLYETPGRQNWSRETPTIKALYLAAGEPQLPPIPYT